MSITTILFDLDGTLLPMDQDEFVKGYFGLLAKKLAPHGYDPNQLVKSIWDATSKMITNDGSRTNEAAFWARFSELYGEKVKEELHLFEDFYIEDFKNAKVFCRIEPKAAELVRWAKSEGFRVALATNPIFPEIATRQRIQWTGLEPEEFELYTTYENSSYSKPNPDYFREVTARLGVQPSECLMVGNDATEDMVAAKLGMKVFLLTDHLINKNEEDITGYPSGSFDDLKQYIESLA